MSEDIVEPVMEREQGTAFDRESIMFASFSDGTVFDYGQWEAADIDEMLKRDGKAKTIEAVLTLPIRQAPHTIGAGQNKAPAQVVDFINEALTTPANNGGMSTSLNLIIAQMTGAISKRRAFFEKVFKQNDEGYTVYDKIAWRPQSTCTITRDKMTGAFQGFKQIPIRWDDTNEISWTPQYSFVYLHGVHRDPMAGVSDMEIPLWCYKTKQKIRFLWYQFLEGQSLPKVVVKAQDQTTADVVAKKVIGLRSGGVVGIDENMVSLDVLQSSGKGADQFQAALNYLDAEASNSVLAGFTDLASAAASGAGSLALSKDQSDFFLMSRQAVTKEMADAINQYLIPDLVAYRFGAKTPCPEFEFGQITEEDAQVTINMLSSLAAAPTLRLPTAFMDELTIKVARYLELDETKVEAGLKQAAADALKAAQNPQQAAVAPIVGPVNAAVRAVAARPAAA